VGNLDIWQALKSAKDKKSPIENRGFSKIILILSEIRPPPALDQFFWSFSSFFLDITFGKKGHIPH
jgi:hypothetical protein